ncbi:hypothetical protein J2S19_005024 [Metabacillus malikii]|uniref:Uncharacterized protein n=1 Tax=Metabacillus malikii TaxID=1504265 RepID=A0ABT9ZN16_9BACI|nr:hypothetical protein [Metabacillus malikii]
MKPKTRREQPRNVLHNAYEAQSTHPKCSS